MFLQISVDSINSNMMTKFRGKNYDQLIIIPVHYIEKLMQETCELHIVLKIINLFTENPNLIKRNTKERRRCDTQFC